MGAATASLCSLFLFHLLLFHRCSAQRPQTGVALFLESGQDSSTGEQVQNNSLISSGSLAPLHGLACYSADDRNNIIGEWRFPDGTTVNQETENQEQVVFADRQVGRVTLQLKDGSQFTSALEGVYSCLIPDETGTVRTLHAGVYTANNYSNLDGPIVATPVEFLLLSHDYHYPPTFTVTCSTSASPPTSLQWTYNDGSVDLSGNSFSSRQRLRNGVSSTYDNILTVTGANAGQYICLVNNTRGSRSGNITVKGPSTAPTSVMASSNGNNSVQVSWTPPARDVRGYRVFYRNGSVTNTLTVGDVSSAVVRELTLGVEYSIIVQAFADFPGQNSSVTTITLNAPSPPQGVTVVSQSPTSLRVTWTASTSAGVNGYEVSYSPADESCDGVTGGRVTVEGGSVRNHELNDLEAHTEYSITVRSRSSDGFGPPSVPRMGTTMADIAGPPQMVTVVGGMNPKRISVQWAEPACSDINAPGVTGYVIRYGLPGQAPMTTPTITSGLSYTISGSNLQLFTDYSIQVAAVNSKGVGQFSQPETAVITGAPGAVSSLGTDQDILSVEVNWRPPQLGAGYITEYEVRHRAGSILLGNPRVSGEWTSYRVVGLLSGTEYQFEVQAFINSLGGPSEQVTATTFEVGQVEGVSVRQLNSSAVNVTWTRLDSQDVFYRVYYSSPDGRADFSGNSSWGVVGRLRGQTRFQVAAVIFVHGLNTEGMKSQTACVIGSGDCTRSGDSLAASVTGSVIGVLLLISLLVVIVVILCYIIIRCKRRLSQAKENIEMVKCQAYEAVKTTNNNAQRLNEVNDDYEPVYNNIVTTS